MVRMGRLVTNLYGTKESYSTLEIVSGGLYCIEISFLSRHYKFMQPYNWCYEQTKGLVYTTDLTMNLSNRMGYKTPRVYLRDYILFLENHWLNAKPTVTWKRDGLCDYVFDESKIKPKAVLVER